MLYEDLLRHIRSEWDALREHDVILLLRIKAPEQVYEGRVSELSVLQFPEKFGVVSVRGAASTQEPDKLY